MDRRIAIPVCLTSLLALFAISASNAFAAASVRVEIKISGAAASGGSLLAISSTGKAVRTKLGSKTVSLNVPKATISGTTLQLVSKSGTFLGPVVLASAPGGKKVYLTLGKNAGAKSSLKLGTAIVNVDVAGQTVAIRVGTGENAAAVAAVATTIATTIAAAAAVATTAAALRSRGLLAAFLQAEAAAAGWRALDGRRVG